MNSKTTGFVYLKTAYKENDYIVNILTYSGTIAFKARGINKMNSKNSSACEYFTISEFLFNHKNETANKVLTSSQVIKTYRLPYINIKVSTVYFLIFDILKQISNEINMYAESILCFDLLEDNNNCLNVLVYFFKLLCTKMGYLPNLKGCFNCHSPKNLVSFDFALGGFVCHNCQDLNTNYRKLNPGFLKVLYQFLKEDDYVVIDEEYLKQLYEMYIDFLNGNTGIYINNDFYKKFFS